ncbi:hypothetical protein C0R09_12660 [Brevibacillus laterosporus]|uniref:hypothetical protein n=1 Tax=Brevibacillus laterosporus TaxID=1465 RepID=UPI000C771832|nr:hypothetical protein [Brevibacillus laterosporus]AUM65307.1 hypothetical protein C0R09_12660 [Brevibacillus laterosporus]
MQYKNKPITGHKEMGVCSRREAWYDGRAFFGILAFLLRVDCHFFPGVTAYQDDLQYEQDYICDKSVLRSCLITKKLENLFFFVIFYKYVQLQLDEAGIICDEKAHDRENHFR